MNKIKAFIFILFFFSVNLVYAQNQMRREEAVDYPEIPRITAHEAFLKYKQGKALIFHAGGESYERRHLQGAFNIDLRNAEKMLAKFPKQGLEMIIYCY
jgi:hypothetical protein